MTCEADRGTLFDAFTFFEGRPGRVRQDPFARESVRVFKALGDPTRYEILCMLLRDDELANGRIQEAFSLSAPTLSHHCKVLENAGLIDSRREGQSVIHRADRERLRKYLPAFERVHAMGGVTD